MRTCWYAAPRRKSALVGVVALLAGLALSGCGPKEIGAAAIVDGDPIRVQQLQDATTGYLAVVPRADRGDAQLRILERMILSRVIDRAARREDVSVSAGEVAAERQQILSSVGGRTRLVQALAEQQPPTVLAPSYLDRWTRDRLLFGKLAEKLGGGQDPTSAEAGEAAGNALVSSAKAMKVRVNPRYGTWNPEQGLQGVVSGGLSRTVEELERPAAGRR